MRGAGMFLNTQSGSVLLAACSRRELAAGLPFAHRLWDILLMAGAIPPLLTALPSPSLILSVASSADRFSGHTRMHHSPEQSGSCRLIPWCWNAILCLLSAGAPLCPTRFTQYRHECSALCCVPLPPCGFVIRLMRLTSQTSHSLNLVLHEDKEEGSLASRHFHPFITLAYPTVRYAILMTISDTLSLQN